MTRRLRLAVSILSIFSASTIAATVDIPAALRAPDTEVLKMQAFAKGVQIYQCKKSADGNYAWAFNAPEATLSDASGQPLGKHYAGPTWEANDSSTIIGEVKAKDPGPDASAIPWLLISAKSNAGKGEFAGIRTVQRVSTSGGIAPSKTCASANADEIVRVPYTATYNFYQ